MPVVKSGGINSILPSQGNGHAFMLDDSSIWNKSEYAHVDVYETMLLPRWRATIRRMLVKSLEKESRIIAKVQVCRYSTHGLYYVALTRIFFMPEFHSYLLVRRLFCIYFITRHTYIFPNPPTRVVFLWFRRIRYWVREVLIWM
jgi:hypothetical protein